MSRSALPTLTLRTVTPCHKKPVRLVALLAVPLERYERTCPECGAEWTVERREAKVTAESRVDILEWSLA